MRFSKKYALIFLYSFFFLNNSGLLHGVGKRAQLGYGNDDIVPTASELSEKPAATKEFSYLQSPVGKVVKDLAIAYVADRGITLAHEMGHAGMALLCGFKVDGLYVEWVPIIGNGGTHVVDYDLTKNALANVSIVLAGPLIGILSIYYISRYTGSEKSLPLKIVLGWHTLSHMHDFMPRPGTDMSQALCTSAYALKEYLIRQQQARLHTQA
ncbi:MAG: M50 family metallopeptidase [Candidatus Babeliales bacterium]